MLELFIPLTGLVSLLAYYFLSSDMKLSKRLAELEKMKNSKTPKSGQQYYGWELHDLI
jgi:hypothetical protein